MPAHSFARSVLHAFPVIATVITRSSQVCDKLVKCDFMQALIRPSPGCMPAHSVLISLAQGFPVCCASATEPESNNAAVSIASPDLIRVTVDYSVKSKKSGRHNMRTSARGNRTTLQRY